MTSKQILSCELDARRCNECHGVESLSCRRNWSPSEIAGITVLVEDFLGEVHLTFPTPIFSHVCFKSAIQRVAVQTRTTFFPIFPTLATFSLRRIWAILGDPTQFSPAWTDLRYTSPKRWKWTGFWTIQASSSNISSWNGNLPGPDCVCLLLFRPVSSLYRITPHAKMSERGEYLHQATQRPPGHVRRTCQRTLPSTVQKRSHWQD